MWILLFRAAGSFDGKCFRNLFSTFLSGKVPRETLQKNASKSHAIKIPDAFLPKRWANRSSQTLDVCLFIDATAFGSPGFLRSFAVNRTRLGKQPLSHLRSVAITGGYQKGTAGGGGPKSVTTFSDKRRDI